MTTQPPLSNKLKLSYSRLVSYDECPRSYFLQYLVEDSVREDNVWAQYGDLMHTIIDRVNKGVIAHDDAVKVYAEEYGGRVTCSFPARMAGADDAYYLAGHEYFSDFKGVIPDAEVLLTEQKMQLDLFGGAFTGIVDMVAKLPDGRIAIVDHKSTASKSFRGKAGNLKFRQLYIYAEILKLTQGYYPDVMMFNCFREGVFVERPFDREELQKTLAWANNVAREIGEMMATFPDDEFGWETHPDYFKCYNICSARSSCEEVVG